MHFWGTAKELQNGAERWVLLVEKEIQLIQF